MFSGDIHPDRKTAPDQSGAEAGLHGRDAEPAEAVLPASSRQDIGNDPDSTQLWVNDGVQKDMATLAASPAFEPLRTAPRQTEDREIPFSSLAAPTADADEDSAVMLQVRAGNDAAFNYLVEKYHRPIVHYMYRMVHNQAIAEELAQEVFLRVYRSRETYRAEARFSTWLYRIATNLGMNHARDTRHERSAHTVYLDEVDAETGTTPDVADTRLSAEEVLVREERLKAIRQQVMALPERQRTAVLMHKYQGLDYRQIGEVLKLSESATKSLLFRAYQTLRERLRGFVEEN